ncbi:hypothetical protein ACFPRL_21475 [Pseudoclavibacter helvolus]
MVDGKGGPCRLHLVSPDRGAKGLERGVEERAQLAHRDLVVARDGERHGGQVEALNALAGRFR